MEEKMSENYLSGKIIYSIISSLSLSNIRELVKKIPSKDNPYSPKEVYKERINERSKIFKAKMRR
jgi:hypothetical protein